MIDLPTGGKETPLRVKEYPKIKVNFSWLGETSSQAIIPIPISMAIHQY
jgi:hypothetical protein